MFWNIPFPIDLFSLNDFDCILVVYEVVKLFIRNILLTKDKLICMNIGEVGRNKGNIDL